MLRLNADNEANKMTVGRPGVDSIGTQTQTS